VTNDALGRVAVLALAQTLIGALLDEIVEAPVAGELAPPDAAASRAANVLVRPSARLGREPLPALRAPTLRHAQSVRRGSTEAELAAAEGARSRRGAGGIRRRGGS
jgi:hypothetical protein